MGFYPIFLPFTTYELNTLKRSLAPALARFSHTGFSMFNRFYHANWIPNIQTRTKHYYSALSLSVRCKMCTQTECECFQSLSFMRLQQYLILSKDCVSRVYGFRTVASCVYLSILRKRGRIHKMEGKCVRRRAFTSAEYPSTGECPTNISSSRGRCFHLKWRKQFNFKGYSLLVSLDSSMVIASFQLIMWNWRNCKRHKSLTNLVVLSPVSP